MEYPRVCSVVFPISCLILLNARSAMGFLPNATGMSVGKSPQTLATHRDMEKRSRGVVTAG
jgi:hypothetical protein